MENSNSTVRPLPIGTCRANGYRSPVVRNYTEYFRSFKIFHSKKTTRAENRYESVWKCNFVSFWVIKSHRRAIWGEYSKFWGALPIEMYRV